MTETLVEPVLHITTAENWAAAEAAGTYVDPSLDAEGFIHCSTPAQVLMPANERFARRSDLILLVIDPRLLSEPMVYEDCYESGMAFPHVYGAINLAAVIGRVPFPPNADGTFSLPPGVRLPA